MSQKTKKTVEEAQKFFKHVQQESERYTTAIPDKSLGEKLRKVKEGAGVVVEHIEKHKDH